MIILVSMRTIENASYPETRDAISQDWQRLFSQYGMTPILVPNAMGEIGDYFKFGALGLLLTGGEDLGPANAPTLRDRTETLLLEGAMKRSLPVFGTCRGLQLINSHFGGRITRELSEEHVGEHEVLLDGQRTIRVNSFHNQGVLADDLATDFAPFAATGSGVIEAIRHRSLPITAVQWHPERPSPAAALDRMLLQQWISQCA